MKKVISVILTIAMIATLCVCLLACSKDAPSKQEGFVGNASDGKYWVNTSHEIVQQLNVSTYIHILEKQSEISGDIEAGLVELHRNLRKNYIVYGIKCNITVDADVEWVIYCCQALSSSLATEQRVQFQKGVSKTIEFSFTEPVDKKFDLALNEIGIAFNDGIKKPYGQGHIDYTKGINKTITDIQLLIAKAE